MSYTKTKNTWQHSWRANRAAEAHENWARSWARLTLLCPKNTKSRGKALTRAQLAPTTAGRNYTKSASAPRRARHEDNLAN